MRVVTWNILMGGEDRLARIFAILAEARPDLVVLQECLSWTTAEMTRLQESTGLAHGHLGQARPRGSGKRYHVAIASRWPLEGVRDHADPSFIGHVIVEARVDGRLLFGTHLDSHHENLRFVEARYLRSVLPADFKSREALLVGDLNSLSARDPYPADLAARVHALGLDKYSHPPRFEVTAELEAQGWVDVLAARNAGSTWATAPREHGLEYRVDYVFASPLLAEKCVEARVLSSNGASDHEPVLAVFR